jgi:DNA-binding GntR family transcriptional regulator
MLLSLLYESSGLSGKPVYRALTDSVVLKILEGAKSGEFVPDQRLSEEDLARRFDVSRAPVRDALHRLDEIGVVERRPPRGLNLRTWNTTDDAEVLALIDALSLLAVQLDFGKLTEDEYEQLERIVEKAKHSPDTGIDEERRQIQRDADFHLIIARASGNRPLVELMERLILPCVLYVTDAHDYLQRDFWVNIRRSLLEALRGGRIGIDRGVNPSRFFFHENKTARLDEQREALHAVYTLGAIRIFRHAVMDKHDVEMHFVQLRHNSRGLSGRL